MSIWSELYQKARAVQNDRTVSPFIEAGGVAAAILTKSGKVYLGVCIDTCSGLGMCAERNAMANMLTHGESEIDKVVAVMPDGRVGSPCGACREFFMQLALENKNMEIMTDYDKREIITLEKLIPQWWGNERYEQK